MFFRNLSGFATVTTAPHLPFEDKYFDVIYCGSVFTHMDDLADAWLLELKRITRPSGRTYITIHDKHSADLISDGDRNSAAFRNLLTYYDREGYLKNCNYSKLSILPGGQHCQVFYDIALPVSGTGAVS